MKKKVKLFFKKNSDRSFKSKEIAKRLKIADDIEYSLLKSTLHALVNENYLTRTGKRYRLGSLPDTNKIVGRFELNPGGFGFVIPKNSELNDIFIAGRNSGSAFHGDLVEVSLFAKQKGKNLEGQITSVIRRKRKEIVGHLKKSNSFYFVTPDDTKIHRDIYIAEEDLLGAQPHDKVAVSDISWEDRMQNPEGKIIEIIGKEGSPLTEIISLAKEFNLATAFKPATIKESSEINIDVNNDVIKHRLDFREKNVITIDPVDAKDFDDALSIETLENGNYKVGVHIADVSHYVDPDSSLDHEAFERGNSVYFVGKAIPMLPEKLSTDICSLVPGEERLTYSVNFEMTDKGIVIDYEINKSIIKSKRRFTYEEVQEIIETGKGDFNNDIILLNNLAQTLRKKRIKEGSLEFYTPEVQFELDDNGKPVAVRRKDIKESNMLVEEFMLLANRTVAEKIISKKTVPMIYRVHDRPEHEKIEEFARFVKSLRYSFNPASPKASTQFHLLMSNIKGTEEEGVINELAIRSMAKAIYSPNNIGHYGLGFKYYSHFTSPIRRYSDLVAHRIISKALKLENGKYYSLEQLIKICEHISATERNALDAERLSVKLKQVQFLRDHIGEEFTAVISGVTNYGLFVKLTDILAEGLIRARDLEGDFYVFDEKKYALIGRRNKKQFRLGDKIHVKLVRVDIDNLELDFITTNNRE